MFDFVTPLLAWLNANPEWAGFVTFIISASESVAIIGTIVPGSITMTALGALAGAGVIPLWETLFFATLGAIVGDGISYWMGHYFKDKLHQMWPFKNNPAILGRGEMFVHKYGIMSVFIGRFIGPVRALVPLVAGMLGMKPLQFTIANVTSAIGWAPAYLLPGMLLGAVSMELPPDIALHVILVLLLVMLFIFLCMWFLYKIIKRISIHIENVENRIWQWFKTHPVGRPITIWLAHHNHTKKHGQFSFALFFLFTAILLIGLMTYVKTMGAPHLAINELSYNFFRSIRSERIDHYVLVTTLLGQKEVLFILGLLVAGLLLIQKRYRLATHIGLLLILTAGSIFLLKNLFHSLRPWGISQAPETYSMPSGHATLSFAIFFGLTYFATRHLSKWTRFSMYCFCSLVVLLVGFSRLYLGAHWFTDILTGWLLGATTLTFVIISYERHTEKPINGLRFVIASFLFLCLSMFAVYQIKFEKMQERYTKIAWPMATLNADAWWQTGKGIPKERTSLFGFPSQRINIQWAGELEAIERTLHQSGWTKPPARDFISTLHRIADIGSTQYLPMISPQYLDSKPKLILVKKDSQNEGLLVIRLWDSHRRFEKSDTALWVGVIDRVPRSYSWLFQDHHGELAISAPYIFPKEHQESVWEWKIVSLPMQAHERADTANTMMLRQK